MAKKCTKKCESTTVEPIVFDVLVAIILLNPKSLNVSRESRQSDVI